MKHTLSVIVVTLAAALLACGSSDKGRAVTLEIDGTTTIHEEKCATKDYVACGQRVRDRTKETLCARNGKGNHPYLYKIGKSEPMRNTALCK